MRDRTCICDVKPKVQDLENMGGKRRRSQGVKIGFCEPGERLGLQSTRDGERNRADKRVLNTCELVMQSLKNRNHEYGERETEIERTRDQSRYTGVEIRIDLYSSFCEQNSR